MKHPAPSGSDPFNASFLVAVGSGRSAPPPTGGPHFSVKKNVGLWGLLGQGCSGQGGGSIAYMVLFTLLGNPRIPCVSSFALLWVATLYPLTAQTKAAHFQNGCWRFQFLSPPGAASVPPASRISRDVPGPSVYDHAPSRRCGIRSPPGGSAFGMGRLESGLSCVSYPVLFFFSKKNLVVTSRLPPGPYSLSGAPGMRRGEMDHNGSAPQGVF